MAVSEYTAEAGVDAISLVAVERIAQRRPCQRHALTIGLRVLVQVVVLGGWEIGGRLESIDPFFFSIPIPHL